jgi:hypothetical protein
MLLTFRRTRPTVPLNSIIILVLKTVPNILDLFIGDVLGEALGEPWGSLFHDHEPMNKVSVFIVH